MSSYSGNTNVSPYINDSLIEASTYSIIESDKFVFNVTNPYVGTNAIMSINAGGYTSIMAVDGVFDPLESTTFDKNVDIPITLSIVNSVTNSVITSLSLNIHWVQVTLQAKMATYFESDNITVNSQTMDNDGNIYIVGEYFSSSSIILKDVSGNTHVNSNVSLPSTIGTSGFTVKYNSSGIVQWATNFSTSRTVYKSDIALDSNGNIYVVGKYTSSDIVTLKNASGNTQVDSNVTLPISGLLSASGFIIKYNSSGLVQWATAIGNIKSEYINKVILDSDNNIYITGSYNINSNIILKNVFGNTQVNSDVTLPYVNVSYISAFVIKYNSSGLVQWATTIDGLNGNYGNNIALDSDNNIYVTGRYNSSANFPLKNASGTTQVNSNVMLPGTSSQSGFIIKYNSSGLVQWATNIDGVSTEIASGISVDSDNNIYIGGRYNSSSNFTLKNASGTTQVNSNVTLPGVPSQAGFIIKYNSSGLVQWATNIDGSGIDFLYGTSIDYDNNIYIIGTYISSSNFALKNASGTTQVNSNVTLPGTSSQSAFIIKYNSSGLVKLATRISNNVLPMTCKSCLFKNGDLIVNFGIATSNITSSDITIYDSLGNSQIPSQVTLPPVSGNKYMGGFVKYHMYDYQQPYDVTMKASLNGGEFLPFEENPKLSFNPNESLQFQAFVTKNVTNNRITEYAMSMSRSSTFNVNEGLYIVEKEVIDNIPVFTFDKNIFLYNPLSSGEIVYFRLQITEDIEEYNIINPTTFYFSAIVN